MARSVEYVGARVNGLTSRFPSVRSGNGTRQSPAGKQPIQEFSETAAIEIGSEGNASGSVAAQ